MQSEESFSDPDELVRLAGVLENYFELRKAVCQTESGILIGKVSDFTFDVSTGQITNIMVVNHQLRPLAHELMLSVSQIIKVEEKMIIVKDLEKPLEIKTDNQEIILSAPNYV